jgi:CHAT domain
MTDQVKILFLSANPKNITHIRLDEEVREVDQKIQMGECRDQLALLPHLAVRPSDLQQTLLRHKPHILHFSGHGSPTEGIVLEDNDGRTKLVKTEKLAALFRVIKDNLRIVVLNACYSSLQAEGISQVVDFTIGMNKAIGDRSAILFSAAFYQGLAFGRSVQESFDLGVSAIGLEGISESDIPVLLTKQGADAAQTQLVLPTADKTEPAGQASSNPPQDGLRGTLIVKDNKINSGRDTVFTGQSKITNYGTSKS